MNATLPMPTTKEAAIIYQTLRYSERAWTAAELAARCGMDGNRESQRRAVREVIRSLRAQGHRIVATLEAGYALTEDESLWRDYLEGRKIDAKRILAEAGRRTKEARETKQEPLFKL